MTGFEPATSCSQSRRATKLRYIPEAVGLPQYSLLFYPMALAPGAIPGAIVLRCF